MKELHRGHCSNIIKNNSVHSQIVWPDLNPSIILFTDYHAFNHCVSVNSVLFLVLLTHYFCEYREVAQFTEPHFFKIRKMLPLSVPLCSHKTLLLPLLLEPYSYLCYSSCVKCYSNLLTSINSFNLYKYDVSFPHFPSPFFPSSFFSSLCFIANVSPFRKSHS